MLETSRLLLRPFTLDDAEIVYRMGSDPLVTRYTQDGVHSLEEAREVLLKNPLADYQKHGYGRWACVLKSTGEVIGFAGLKYLDQFGEPDIGYRFLPAHWGVGLATEAARAALDHGFTELRLKRVIGLVLPENVASVRILQKLGLTFVEMFDNHGLQAAKYAIEAP